MRLLLVEDDDRVAAALGRLLGHQGFQVERAGTTADAKELLGPATDAVLLDLGLPDGDGLELCRWIRDRSAVPVLVVTARSDIESRVRGLDLGADDYLVKPYDARELLARLRAVTRRTGKGSEQAAAPLTPRAALDVRVGALTLNRATREARLREQPLPLSRREFDLLEMLSRAPGVVFRRDLLLRELWGSSWATSAHSLEVHVASLRAKAGAPDLIETVRGVGYRLAS